VRTGRLTVDPAVRLASPRRDRALPGVLAQSEATALLDIAELAADDGDPVHLRDRAALELLYATGVRVGELVALDVDDVDFERRTIRVLGKGAKERVVPFGVPAARALQAWLTQGRPALAAPSSGAALLLGRRGGRVDQRQVRAAVHALMSHVGVQATSARTGCGTRRPLICSREEPTYAAYRSCLVTLRYIQRSSTHTCPSKG
jgi:integrase/recombinase XerC